MTVMQVLYTINSCVTVHNIVKLVRFHKACVVVVGKSVKGELPEARSLRESYESVCDVIPDNWV